MARLSDLAVSDYPMGIEIRIWAPALDVCTLELTDCVGDNSNRELVELVRRPDGFHSGLLPERFENYLYQIVLPCGKRIPDPMALENIGGVHGKSIIDRSGAARRCNDNWTGTPIDEAIIYELHVGTFTPEGTFCAAARQLSSLSQIGITVIQLMPVWLTPGARSWGYDPVSFFTLNGAYGSIEELKSFIDDAHRHGISVTLDCVYNHLGPEGSYFPVLAPSILCEENRTPWGPGLNLTGSDSAIVQGLIFESLVYWIDHIGFDGVRIDAGEHLRPDGKTKFLKDIASVVRHACRHQNPIVILEHDLDRLNENDVSELLSEDGFQRVWGRSAIPANDHGDDFSLLSGIVSTLAEQSNFYHGNGCSDYKLLNYLRSHDTIGNSGLAKRNDRLNLEVLEAAQQFLLLAPTTPMLFMGDECLADEPFHYFCDLVDIAPEDIVKARSLEFPEVAFDVPEPHTGEAFLQSKLDWNIDRGDKADANTKRVQAALEFRENYVVPLLAKKVSYIDVQHSADALSITASWVFSEQDRYSISVSAVDSSNKIQSYEYSSRFGVFLRNLTSRGQYAIDVSAPSCSKLKLVEGA